MRLEQVLQKAVENIRSGRLSDEAKVKTTVIVPILRALDWDDLNPAELVAEFPVANGWVDYALCQRADKPLVFIEAKRLGLVDIKGEEQLFNYATNKGVPFLILTDGNVWDFYLSMAVGVAAERKFYHAELEREENISKYTRFFEDHLQKNHVISGKAKRAAEQLHEDNRERDKARDTIPKAWCSLLNAPDKRLQDLLAEAVEDECETRPKLDDVEEFLKTLEPNASPRQSDPAKSPSPLLPKKPQPRGKMPKMTGFVLNGRKVITGAGIRTLAEILKEFQTRDSGFMKRFDSEAGGRTVAQNRENVREPHDLKNGWWLRGSLNSKDIKKKIKTACNVTEVQFGSELTLIEE